MSQCLKIHVRGDSSRQITDFVYKHAKQYGLEGLVQGTEGQWQIIACGPKGGLDHFLDALHQGEKKIKLSQIMVEPFMKSKDYRGVFRIIE